MVTHLDKAGIDVDKLHPAVPLHVVAQDGVHSTVSLSQRSLGTTARKKGLEKNESSGWILLAHLAYQEHEECLRLFTSYKRTYSLDSLSNCLGTVSIVFLSNRQNNNLIKYYNIIKVFLLMKGF